MALFGRKKEIVPLPPIAQWEYRCGDGHHWGFHYRVAEEQDHVRLTYSRTIPEHLESIAAPAVLWQQLSELGEVCEAYTLYQLDRSFGSLDYYKKLRAQLQ